MYKNILVPIALDHEHDSSEALTIAQRLLADGGTVTALHVIEELPAYVAQQLPEGQLESAKAETQRLLERETTGTPNVSTKVVRGHSGRTILDYAKEYGTDCIVIASHRPGLQDYLLGSTAARVVRHAQCAVHVLR